MPGMRIHKAARFRVCPKKPLHPTSWFSLCFTMYLPAAMRRSVLSTKRSSPSISGPDAMSSKYDSCGTRCPPVNVRFARSQAFAGLRHATGGGMAHLLLGEEPRDHERIIH